MTPFVFEKLGKKDQVSVIIVSPLVALIAQCEKLKSKGLCAIHLNKDSKATELGKCRYIFCQPRDAS